MLNHILDIWYDFYVLSYTCQNCPVCMARVIIFQRAIRSDTFTHPLIRIPRFSYQSGRGAHYPIIILTLHTTFWQTWFEVWIMIEIAQPGSCLDMNHKSSVPFLGYQFLYLIIVILTSFYIFVTFMTDTVFIHYNTFHQYTLFYQTQSWTVLDLQFNLSAYLV